MPIWLLPVLQFLPTLFNFIGGLIKSNPPPVTATPEVHAAYQGLIESHEATALHLDKMIANAKNMSI